MYISVNQAAEKWGISGRRVRILCSEGKIPGVIREGRGWKIPEDAKKPKDGQYKSAESLLEMIDRKKAEYPPIDIKFTDRIAYYNAFDEYYVKHNLGGMEKLFAGYVNTRLDNYLAMLKE